MLKLRIIGDEKRDLFLVEPGVVIGSAAGSGLLLSNPGIQAKHAQIEVSADQITLKNTSNDPNLLLNGQIVSDDSPLNVGDEINIAGVRLMLIDPKTGFVAKTPEADTGGSTPWSIRANHSALNNRVYPITGSMVLGRSNECDITLSVSHLSRKHAEVSVVGNKLMVKDLDSANGTYINGKRVTEDTLKKGDELRLDTLSFTVVGPADDMDKTSVRSAIDPSLLAAAAAAPAKPAPAPVTASKPAAERPAAKAAPRPDAQKPSPGQQTQKVEADGGGSNIIAIVVVVLAIAAVAGYFVLA